MSSTSEPQRVDRRSFLGLGAGAGALALACSSVRAASLAAPGPQSSGAPPKSARTGYPIMVGSQNALAGMQQFYKSLQDGADPLDAAIEVVKVTEADPKDTSVGLGGLPNADGVVQLDAACMYGPTHKSGGVACIENILHPSEVARLVLERTDHCLLVGKGAYDFARMHGHPHVELLTDESREQWVKWKETLSSEDDWLPPPPKPGEPAKKTGALEHDAGDRLAARRAALATRQWGTIHCSALSTRGEIACTTTTSGLAFKVPGRVGDSPIVGAGLYCDQEVGSAGATGRGEAAILANGSFAIVELMRQGASPEEAGLEVLRRIARQAERLARWQPELLGADGKPSFGINFYVLALDGRWAGVTLKGQARFTVADPEHGPRHVELKPLFA